MATPVVEERRRTGQKRAGQLLRVDHACGAARENTARMRGERLSPRSRVRALSRTSGPVHSLSALGLRGRDTLLRRRPDCGGSCSAGVPASPSSVSRSWVAATASAIAKSSGSWRSSSSTSQSSRSSCTADFRCRCPAARDRRGDKSMPSGSASLPPPRSPPSRLRCRRRTNHGEASCR